MTTQPVYQIPTSSEPEESGKEIPTVMLAYFRGRFSNKLHELVLREFAAQERAGKTSRAKLARKIKRKPEQITRWLGSPGNWTIDTVSDLLLGMGMEPVISARKITEERTSYWKDAPHATQTVTTTFPILHVQSAYEVAQDITNGNHKPFYISVMSPFSIRTNIELLPIASAESGSMTELSVATHERHYLDNNSTRIKR